VRDIQLRRLGPAAAHFQILTNPLHPAFSRCWSGFGGAVNDRGVQQDQRWIDGRLALAAARWRGGL
jgi:hypothetical protein